MQSCLILVHHMFAKGGKSYYFSADRVMYKIQRLTKKMAEAVLPAADPPNSPPMKILRNINTVIPTSETQRNRATVKPSTLEGTLYTSPFYFL